MNDALGWNHDFVDLFRELLAARVEFVIVGAHAVAVHGVPRATGDLDIFVRPTPENAARLLEALRAWGANVDEHGITIGELTTPNLVYQIGLPPRRIDLLTGLAGVTFETAWSSRVTASMAGFQLPVIGKEALLRNKQSTGRAKDRLDIALLSGEE